MRTKRSTMTRLATGLLLALWLGGASAATIGFDQPDGASVPTAVAAGYTELSVATGAEARVTLLRLHDGTEPAALEAAMAEVNAGIAGQADFVAAANALLEIADIVLEVEAVPGGPVAAGAVLVPGRYAIQYWPTTQDGSGTPTYRYFRAEGEGDAAPAADVTVSLANFVFSIPTDLAAGSQTWEVVNDADQIHHMVVFRLDDGATFDDFTAWLRSESGPPPARQTAHVGVMGPGRSVYQTLELSAGSYVAICFIPDHAHGGSGAPHFVHGMIQPFQVGD